MKKKACSLILARLLLLLPMMVSASNFYLLPLSNRQYITTDEAWAWQYEALEYARMEILARHGKPFSKGNQFYQYFNSQLWYEESPHYPGDNAVLSKLEKENYDFIGKVLSNMRSQGTNNPNGKRLPHVFDDRIETPLSGFELMAFKSNQNLKVYDGPDSLYRRAANGKAVANTNGAVYVAGWENGWLMVMYQLSKGGIRVGFVNPKDFSDRIDAPRLLFEYQLTQTNHETILYEDPLMTLTTIARLPANTPVTWISRFYTNDEVWDYVETNVDGQLCRGFLSYGAVTLVMNLDLSTLE